MNKYIIVTDKQKLIDVDDNYIILSPREFIGQKFEIFKKQDRVKVINLSPNYEYLSLGYYVSLMCQARSVLCFPDLSNVVSLNWQKNHSHYFSDLNRILENIMIYRLKTHMCEGLLVFLADMWTQSLSH